MTQYSGQIRLKKEPSDMIKWFTKNWDKEIGALGVGLVEDGELVVEKLVFPTQIVNGGHVHFKPSDWAPIMTELTDEEMEKLIFYWHKHPNGMPGASQGDEDETFDVFMDKTSGRPIFGFLQSAMCSGEIKYSGRIEMRQPIWCSITDVNIATDEDDQIEETCKEIIRTKVTEGHASSRDQPGSLDKDNSVIVTYEEYKKDIKNLLKPDKNDKTPTELPEFNLQISNGGITIEFDTEAEEYIEMILEYEDIKPLISQQSVFQTTCRGKGYMRVFPKKGVLHQLLAKLKENQEIFRQYAYGFIDESIEDTIKNNIDTAVKGNLACKGATEFTDYYNIHKDW